LQSNVANGTDENDVLLFLNRYEKITIRTEQIFSVRIAVQKQYRKGGRCMESFQIF